MVGRVRVVRDHDDGLPEVVDRPAQELQDLLAGARVEVAGRFVGEQHGRLADERPGDGDPLLLATGELGRLVAETVGQADGRHEIRKPRRVELASGDGQR